MLIETFAGSQLFSPQKLENYGAPEDIKTEEALLIALYILWIFLWVTTIVHSIGNAKRKRNNNGVGLIMSVLSWPFYWLYYITNVV